MPNRALFAVLVLCVGLSACERRAQELVLEPVGAKSAAITPEKKPLSAEPEHFDRVRDEQLEKEEDRLRQRSQHN